MLTIAATQWSGPPPQRLLPEKKFMSPVSDPHRSTAHHASSPANFFAPPSAHLVRVGSRRWFLQTGMTGMAGLSMPALLKARAQAGANRGSINDRKAVI